MMALPHNLIIEQIHAACHLTYDPLMRDLCPGVQVTKTQEASLRVMWGAEAEAAAPAPVLAPAAAPLPGTMPRPLKGP